MVLARGEEEIRLQYIHYDDIGMSAGVKLWYRGVVKKHRKVYV